VKISGVLGTILTDPEETNQRNRRNTVKTRCVTAPQVVGRGEGPKMKSPTPIEVAEKKSP